MPLPPNHIAIHEAAHAVMQWFIGWESDLRFLQMRRVDGGATEGKTNARRPTCKDLSAVRKRLVFLCVGTAAATKKLNRDVYDFDDDFRDAAQALAQYLGDVKTVPTSIRLEPREADQLLQDAIQKANDLINDPDLWRCIDEVSELLLNALPAADGLCVVSNSDVVAKCDEVCGPGFRENHKLAGWLSGA